MLILLALLAAGAPARTFRVDYVHVGTASEERFALERLVLEPLPWPGNADRPIDDTDSGKYLFEVRDRATGRLLYSRGFSSIFGEWETTAEAKQVPRAFSESLRFPAPAAPVQIVLRKRDPRSNLFREAWTLAVDPRDPSVDHSPPPAAGELIALQRTGDPAGKVDLLLLDGYTARERGKFEKDARRLMEVLFSTSPFKERREDFNVWGLCPPAAQSGISRPSLGIHRRSPAGAPYELVEIVANARTYGGGGIFNLYGTVAADSRWAPYIFVHEFAHHLAGLADEYFTSPTAYEKQADRPEPWERNVTADPHRPKWAALLTPAAPLATPWDEDGFIEWQKGVQERRRRIRAERKPESEMDPSIASSTSTPRVRRQDPARRADRGPQGAARASARSPLRARGSPSPAPGGDPAPVRRAAPRNTWSRSPAGLAATSSPRKSCPAGCRPRASRAGR